MRVFPVQGQDLTVRRATRSEAYSEEFLRDAVFGHLRVLRWGVGRLQPYVVAACDCQLNFTDTGILGE